MKRHGNLYHQICSLENLYWADDKAQKGKKRKPEVLRHNANRDEHITHLQASLLNKTFTTGAYRTFTIYEPKERIVHCLPYTDRIVHHAILNILESIFTGMYTADTYSCIKGRGIHQAAKKLRKALSDRERTMYCLKLDIKKFYPSVDHDILKAQLRRKIKDNDLLWLLDDIIDSAPGLPIGNYLSQYFANLYLTGFDHWLKEIKGVKYYFRYADDIVILSSNKPHLHSLLHDIRQYLDEKLKLTVKDNYQVFPVAARGIDFVGYKFYHTHTLLRKSIKKRFARMLKRNPNPASIAAYRGWTLHCNSQHLLKTLLPNEQLQRFQYYNR